MVYPGFFGSSHHILRSEWLPTDTIKVMDKLQSKSATSVPLFLAPISGSSACAILEYANCADWDNESRWIVIELNHAFYLSTICHRCSAYLDCLNLPSFSCIKRGDPARNQQKPSPGLQPCRLMEGLTLTYPKPKPVSTRHRPSCYSYHQTNPQIHS